MSAYRNYVISSILSLAFWISIFIYLNFFLKAQKPKEQTILLPPVVLNKPISIPKQTPIEDKSIKTLPQKQAINQTPTPQPTPKPIQKPQPIPQSIPNIAKSNIGPSTTPALPETPKNPLQPPTPTPKPVKNTTNNSNGDYFKNAYTPPKPIYAPKPHIPQSLLPSVNELNLRVKFLIRKDGSCRAMLLNPTPNPSLNTLLTRELSNWKFFPATKAQKPTDSSLTLEVHINIE